MKKKIINAILGVLTLALLVVGFIFMFTNAGVNQILFFVFLAMHIAGWLLITVTDTLFVYTKKTNRVQKAE